MPVTPLRFTCAKTVSKLHLFEPLGLLFERKQVPQIVVIVRIRRKTTEPLEATRLASRCAGRGLSSDSPVGILTSEKAQARFRGKVVEVALVAAVKVAAVADIQPARIVG